MVHFFHQVAGVPSITKEVLSARTNDYQSWVEAFARNHQTPIEWAESGVRKEEYVRPALRRMQKRGQHGVYFILKSMEQGHTFRSSPPKFPTADPNYRILARQRSRFTHYFFYIHDEVLGPMAMRVASFFPFQATYYLNGHHFIEKALNRERVTFRKNDNAFLAVSHPEALQAAADRFTADVIRERLEYWTLVLGPKFSKRERRHEPAPVLRHPPDRVLPQLHLQAPLPHPQDLRALLRDRTVASDRPQNFRDLRHAHHQEDEGQTEHQVGTDRARPSHLPGLCRNAFVKQYEKFSTFLRNEVCSNNLADFGLKKGLPHLAAVRHKFLAITGRFAAFQAQCLNVHADFPLLQRLAPPIAIGTAKYPGIKIHDTRMIRLMEVLPHAGTSVAGWRAAQIHEAVLTQFCLSAGRYTLNNSATIYGR